MREDLEEFKHDLGTCRRTLELVLSWGRVPEDERQVLGDALLALRRLRGEANFDADRGRGRG